MPSDLDFETAFESQLSEVPQDHYDEAFVPGVGPPDAALMIVGEAPGADEVAEVRAWLPVLEAELARVDPAVVLTPGNAATRAVLDRDEGITDLRGQCYERDGWVVVPTFHPAATFYDESKRGAIETDLATVVDGLSRGE